MENAPQIENMFEKLIKPSSPTPDHLRVYKLSLFDRVVSVSRIYAPMVFFYPPKGNIDPIETTTRIEQLEKSLSEILCFYYPLAGRISSPDLVTVDCHDQGVLFIVKKARTQMKDLATEKTDPENDFSIVDCLLPSRYVEGGDQIVEAPPMKVQISVFECGGLTVGVNILKFLVDGFSATRFYDDWAKLMRSCGSIRVNISFDASEVFPPQLEKISEKVNSGALKTQEKTKKKNLVARRVFFDDITILTLKDRIMSSGRWRFERPPSKVEVVTAVVWGGKIRAAQDKNGHLRPSITALSVNLRGRLGLSNKLENSFGNIFIPALVKFFPDESEMELYDLVCLIRDSVQKMVSECSKASKEDICSMMIKAMNEMEEWASKVDEVDAVFGTSTCRFPLYDVDFGWGKPSRVSFTTLKFPTFVLLDRESGSGVEVMLNRDEPDMERSIAHIMNVMHAFIRKS